MDDIDIDKFRESFRRMLGKPENLNDWSDTEPGLKPIMNLHEMTNEQIVNLGAETFNEMRSEITTKTVAAIILLAYNLRDNEDRRLFGDAPAELVSIDDSVEFEHIPVTVLKKPNNSGKIRIREGVKAGEVSKAFCYLACAYLRLYTKPAGNLARIADHLKTKFQDFYSFRFPLEQFHPSEDAINAIKTELEINRRLKNTFYVLLYAGESVAEGKKLKEFLYASHVAYAGLHPYTLFDRLMKTLGLSREKLAKALYHVQIESELKAIEGVFSVLCDPNRAGKELQMWKYAKLFNGGFLSRLQTKECQLFTLTLANLLLLVDPMSNRGVLKIAQIENAIEFDKKQAVAYAKRAYAAIMDSGSSSS